MTLYSRKFWLQISALIRDTLTDVLRCVSSFLEAIKGATYDTRLHTISFPRLLPTVLTNRFLILRHTFLEIESTFK